MKADRSTFHLIAVVILALVVMGLVGVYTFQPPSSESCPSAPSGVCPAPVPCPSPETPEVTPPVTVVTTNDGGSPDDVTFAKSLLDYWDNTEHCTERICRARSVCAPCMTGIYKLLSTYSLSGGVMTSKVKVAVAEIQTRYQLQGLIRESPNCYDNWLDDKRTIRADDYFHVFTPTIDCEDRFRAGVSGDGGKYLCNPWKLGSLGRQCVAYSFGTSTEVQYDLAVESLFGCDVHTFDPTVKKGGSRVNEHHPWALGPCFDSHPLYSLDDIPPTYWSSSDVWIFRNEFRCIDLRTASIELGHKNVDILKMDVEGNEMTWLSYVSQTDPGILAELGVKMILLEYHAFNGAIPYTTALTCLRRNKEVGRIVRILARLGYYMYALEYNVLWAESQGGHGGGAEFSFVHKDWV